MTPTRRRFLAITAAAAAAAPAGAATVGAVRWRGAAMGAAASIAIVDPDQAAARRMATAVEREIDRLEALFSLYRPHSALSRLNRDGVLAAPAPEMLELFSLATAVHRATGGAFDPTVQGLWRLHEDAAKAGEAPGAAALAAARRSLGWDGVAYDPAAARFARPGMAATLNGIAQGFVSDRIAALLRRRGYRDVLVDMGEIAALGVRPDGAPWRVGVADGGGALVRRVSLSNRALATSAPGASSIGDAAHIFDPRGAGGRRRRLVSVSAGRAALADALSTAFCLMTAPEIDRALSLFPDARVEANLV